MKTDLQNNRIIQELRLIKGKLLSKPFLGFLLDLIFLITFKRQRNCLDNKHNKEPEKEKKSYP